MVHIEEATILQERVRQNTLQEKVPGASSSIGSKEESLDYLEEKRPKKKIIYDNQLARTT